VKQKRNNQRDVNGNIYHGRFNHKNYVHTDFADDGSPEIGLGLLNAWEETCEQGLELKKTLLAEFQ
jgi:hypothetical protein